MTFLSRLLIEQPVYAPFTAGLLHAFARERITPVFCGGTKDIWLRDFMPVKTKSGRYVAFRYAPSYLKGYEHLQTDCRDLTPALPKPVIRSSIRLDGGNLVWSPSKETVLISDRLFTENPDRKPHALIAALERLLEAAVIVIESLPGDMTGHADGMVRFVDETTVVGNDTPYRNGLEQRIRRQLRAHGIRTVPFPYYASPGISAAGCYLNWYETATAVFLPTFGSPADARAIEAAGLLHKRIIPVDCRIIADRGGVLNCITWEM